MPHGCSYNPYIGSYVPHWSFDEYLFVFHPKLPMMNITQNAQGYLPVACSMYQIDDHKVCISFFCLPL